MAYLTTLRGTTIPLRKVSKEQTMPSTVLTTLSLDIASVSDTFGVMIEKEQQIANSCTNYFQQYSCDASAVVDEKDRTKMVHWCYDIVDECKLDRECVALVREAMACDMLLCAPTVFI